MKMDIYKLNDCRLALQNKCLPYREIQTAAQEKYFVMLQFLEYPRPLSPH